MELDHLNLWEKIQLLIIIVLPIVVISYGLYWDHYGKYKEKPDENDKHARFRKRVRRTVDRIKKDEEDDF